MKIAILGAGRMGSLVGGFATKGGAECYMIDTWQEHVDAINANGLTIYNNETNFYSSMQSVHES